jgi:hypothetical protein
MMPVSFDVSKKDADLIRRIAERRRAMLSPLPKPLTPIMMDLTACHANGCPLDLAGLLAADDSNFIHDVCGINAHLDRRTGKLCDCFLPRFAKRED